MLSVFLFLIALSSCTLTPEDKLIQDLAPKLTEIDTPSNIQVTNDSPNHLISVTWDPVENATYYIFEYQETSVYQGSDTDVFLQVIRNTNSYDLKVPEEQDRDKRYVFRIRAVCLEKNTAGQVFNELESDWTELYEGVIADYLTVTYVKQDNVVTVFESVSNVTSLDNKNLVDIEVRYFDYPYSDQDVFDDSWKEIDVDGIKLESNQSYSLTAVLFVNDAPVAMTGLEIRGDIDYTQPSVTELTAVNNDKTSISLSWNAVQAAAGVEADVKYAIQRKASNEESWSYITVSAEDDSPLLLEDTEYVDENVVSNVSYDYRVLTTYVLQSDGSVLIQNSSAASYIEDCHLIDIRPEKFSAQVISEEDQGDEFVLKVKLSVDPLHDDIFTCKSFSYVITRHESGSDKTISSPHIKTSEYEDTIRLSSEEHRLPHTYYYTIEYFYSGDSISTETITALNHNNDEPFFYEVEGTLPTFDFINSFSLASEVPLAGEIPLKWTIAVPEETTLNQENLKITLTRRDTGSVEVETLLDNVSYSDSLQSYSDETAKIGSVYEYQLIVTYVDESSEYNGVFERSEYIEASVLSYPSNLTATVNESSENIELSWTPVEHASGYIINYKAKNSEQPLTKTIEGGDTSAAKLTTDDEVTPGLVYEISIQSKDEDGNRTNASPSVEGSILGPVPLTVENGVDEIKISWEPGENINIYSIRIKNETGKVFDPIPVSGSTTEYVLNADNLPESILEGSAYPLSEKYYFAVIPNDINIDEDSIGYVEGYWIRPPKEINATKSEYRDNIRISWEKVDDEYTYILYKRTHGTDEPWEFVEYVFPSDTSGEVAYYYVTTDEEYDFTVASVFNGEEGLVQNVFKADVNYGYPLVKPKRFGATDLGTGQFRIYFERVKGATEYIVNLDVIGEIIVKESESGEITATSSNYSNYEISVETDESGMIHLYLPEIPLEELRRVTWDVSVAARNSGIEDSSRNTTEATVITKNYNPEGMVPEDYINISMTIISYYISLADSSFRGDWWYPIGRSFSTDGFSAETCLGSNADVEPTDMGSADFNGTMYNDIQFTGHLECISSFNDWGAAGTDPLEKVSGTVNVVFPLGIYENIQLTFNEYYVDGDNGTVTVSYLDKKTGEVIDGSAKTFNADELNVSLL